MLPKCTFTRFQKSRNCLRCEDFRVVEKMVARQKSVTFVAKPESFTALKCEARRSITKHTLRYRQSIINQLIS